MRLTQIVTNPGRTRNRERMRVPDVVPRQRPTTAEGFVFITVEDEDGLMNVIVKSDVYGRYYKVLRNCFLLIVAGTVQKQPGILNALPEGAVGMWRPPLFGADGMTSER